MVSVPIDSRVETHSTGVGWPHYGGFYLWCRLPAIVGGALQQPHCLDPSRSGQVSPRFVSPWPTRSFCYDLHVMTAIWSSSFNGFFRSRRLPDRPASRTKWVGVHTHEVFRDTVNGFSPAVAAVIGAAVLASAASSLLSGGTHVAATIAWSRRRRKPGGRSGKSIRLLRRQLIPLGSS
jgi:hypothetical protein